jgi:uncharacterized membrane protein YkoI
MNVVRVWVAVTALALAGILPAVPRARAAGARSAPAVKSARMSMDQAIKMVEARFKARVVRADTRRQGGQVIYVMRLLDRHGRVFTVRVDASSGTVL